MFSVYKPFHGVLFSVLLVYLHCGSIMSWSSPVLPKVIGPNYTDDFFGGPLTTQEATWMASLLTLGAALGTVVSGCINTRFGRKTCTLLLLLPSITGYTLMSTVRVIEVLYFARLFAGVTVGGVSSTVTPFICELASKRTRGLATCVAGSSVCLGYIFSYSLGPYVTVLTFNISILSIGVLSFLVFYFLSEESPHYHVLNNNTFAAERALCKYRSSQDDIKLELQEISTQIQKQYEGSFLDMLRSKTVLKSLILAIMLMVFQNLTGTAAVQYYMQPIFEMVGSSLNPEIPPIIVGCIQYFGASIGCLFIDKCGRKTVLYISSVAMMVSQIPLGLFCYLKGQEYDVDFITFLPILCMAVFASFYNLGWGNIPWLIASEIFPTRVKMVFMFVVSFFTFISSFIVTRFFDDLVKAIGIGETFWLFAGCCAISILFVKFCVTETTGKTLEEIQDTLNKD